MNVHARPGSLAENVASVLEKLGIPTAVLCTEPFDNTARSMARRRGFPNYRYVLVEHPLSSARPEGIADKCRACVRRTEQPGRSCLAGPH